MNLKCYQKQNLSYEDRFLFIRNAKNKEEAKRIVLNHGMLGSVDYVIYKNKRYTIKEVYKWKS